jgi:hypothetical protein
MFTRHGEFTSTIDAPPDKVFPSLDDQTRLSAHMSKRSWKMGWGKMETILDDQRGQAVGSHITLHGRVLGIRLFLDEVVTMREVPYRKRWATVGEPRLLVIGPYEMGFALSDDSPGKTSICVDIDYALPSKGIGRLLGLWFGRSYAAWCVRRMVIDASHAARGVSRG